MRNIAYDFKRQFIFTNVHIYSGGNKEMRKICIFNYLFQFKNIAIQMKTPHKLKFTEPHSSVKLSMWFHSMEKIITKKYNFSGSACEIYAFNQI